jgi:hypothetical protein
MSYLNKIQKITAGEVPTESMPMFRDGQYLTADKKARIYTAFVRFVKSDFDPRKFSKDLYKHLSLQFGFIAHYDLSGFYHARFADPDGRMKTYERIAQASQSNFNDENTSGCGDINKAIQEVVLKNKPKFLEGAKNQKVKMLLEQKAKISEELKKLGHKEEVQSGYTRLIATSALTMKDQAAAMECVQYILDTEADDYYEQCAEKGITPKDWEKCEHIFVAALKAAGIKPEPTDFLDQDEA